MNGLKKKANPAPDDPNAGGYPFGNSDVPVGRYVIENGRIEAQVLASAPLPEGHRKEALCHYKNLLAFYLKPSNAAGLGTLPDLNPLGAITPEDKPEAYLENMCRVFSAVSPFEETDETAFAPLLSESYDQ